MTNRHKILFTSKNTTYTTSHPREEYRSTLNHRQLSLNESHITILFLLDHCNLPNPHCQTTSHPPSCSSIQPPDAHQTTNNNKIMKPAFWLTTLHYSCEKNLVSNLPLLSIENRSYVRYTDYIRITVEFGLQVLNRT